MSRATLPPQIFLQHCIPIPTVPRPGNGKVDRIKVTVSIAGVELNDIFTDLQVFVVGYGIVTNFSTGNGPKDNIFYILLDEKLVHDTDISFATTGLRWWFVSNPNLKSKNGDKLVLIDAVPPDEGEVADAAPPIICHTLAVANRDRLFVHFSEPVVNGVFGALVASDFEYPVGTDATAFIWPPTATEFELDLVGDVPPIEIAQSANMQVTNGPQDLVGNNLFSVTHRVTDIGLGLVGDGVLEPVWANDGIFAIYDFNGNPVDPERRQHPRGGRPRHHRAQPYYQAMVRREHPAGLPVTERPVATIVRCQGVQRACAPAGRHGPGPERHEYRRYPPF